MTQPIQPAEPTQEWVFTFGDGQTLPDGTDAYGHFVAINGTWDTARAEMLARFGNTWCDQYSSRERAGVDAFHLTQYRDTITATAAGPVDRERVLVEATEPAIYAEILHRLPTGVEGTDGGDQR